MVDVGTGLAALGTAEVSKDMLAKMLGPTAEYFGDGVRSWTEKRTANVQRVFAKAHRRLGDDINRPGAVPPRVLKAVLDEAQVADDELVAEYLGGVLASSRSEISRDDRSAVTARLIASLSTYAIRTHYVFYAMARQHLRGSDANELRLVSGATDTRMFVSTPGYLAAMAFDKAELANYDGIRADTMLTLHRNSLLGDYLMADPEGLRSRQGSFTFPEHGIVYDVTQQGVALFCMAHGIRTDPYSAFVSQQSEFNIDGGPVIPQATHVADLPPYSPPEAE
jgi:hypothetical protein